MLLLLTRFVRSSNFTQTVHTPSCFLIEAAECAVYPDKRMSHHHLVTALQGGRRCIQLTDLLFKSHESFSICEVWDIVYRKGNAASLILLLFPVPMLS